MFKKIFFSFIVTLLVASTLASPAAAVKPDKIIMPGPLEVRVVNCDVYGYDFWIWDHWDEMDTFHFKYNQDGTLNTILGHAFVTHTYYTIPDTGKQIISTGSGIYFMDTFLSNPFTLRGNIQLVTIPGVGRIYAEAGNKTFEYAFNPDGSIEFNLVENAGPTSFLSNDYSDLCKYLAP